MRVGAVIAAAGTPGGFRAYDKLKNTDRNVMLRRMIYTFRHAGVEDVAVVRPDTGRKRRRRVLLSLERYS